MGWDDPVPADLHEVWSKYKEQLPLLNNLRYHRCITSESSRKLQLHGFCDANEKAYGACIYLRSTNDQGNHQCKLICSKSRVAPVTTATLPKLELCAATLLVQLFNSTVSFLRMHFSRTAFWSDSTIALKWINSTPQTLVTFVANRVAEIQASTQPHD